MSSSNNLFYGSDGFAFSEPGRHTIDVIILWDVRGAPVLAQGSTEVWVSYPVTAADNEIAATLLDRSVGEYIALGGKSSNQEASDRLKAALSIQKKHPACLSIQSLGL